MPTEEVFSEKVRRAIADKFIYSTSSTYVKLIEEKNIHPKHGVDAKTLCREIHINLSDLDNPPLVLQLDLEERGLKLHPLLKQGNDSGINRRCDYVFICNHDNKTYVIIAELKSLNEGSWRQQCVVGESLINYIMSAIDRTSGKHFRKNFIYRHVLFTTDTNIIHKRLLGNKTVKYRYNSFYDSHFSIQGCNNSKKSALHLKNFLM